MLYNLDFQLALLTCVATLPGCQPAGARTPPNPSPVTGHPSPEAIQNSATPETRNLRSGLNTENSKLNTPPPIQNPKSKIQNYYGPAKVSFDLQVSGSPYDAEANDIRVRFTSGKNVEERFAYFDGQRWDAVLLTTHPGVYQAAVLDNGKTLKKLPGNLNVNNRSTTTFVRVDGSGRSFELSDGKPFWPMGHNLGWQDPKNPPIPVQIESMGQDGMNWSRIWDCAWDGKNPYWPQYNHRLPDRDLDQAAFHKWDAIVEAADRAGIRFQWVVFHHGLFSSEVDPNWPQHPWNAANGGFLRDPKLFFTDPEAVRRAKNLLRYLVARYGHEPSVLSWELFNEVENTDAARSGDWKDIADWHHEMADYLRSIDPYHHLITSSSELRPEVISALDYYQPHGYPANVAAMLANAKVLTDKPFFFGEVGLGGGSPTPEDQRRTVRDAIWAALLAGHSGSAQFWYWDAVHQDKLGSEYAHAAQIVMELGIRPGPSVEPCSAVIDSPLGADLLFTPGLSWAPSTQTSFDLSKDATAKAMGGLSSFLQGASHRDMGSQVDFELNAPSDGKLTIAVGTVARSGASIAISVDGTTAQSKTWPTGSRDTPVNQTLEAPYAKGRHHITVSNTGADWVTIGSYRFSSIGRAASGSFSVWNGSVIGRVHRNVSVATSFGLKRLPLKDGIYSLRIWDLDSMLTTQGTVAVTAGAVEQKLRLDGSDAIVWLR